MRDDGTRPIVNTIIGLSAGIIAGTVVAIVVTMEAVGLAEWICLRLFGH